MFQDNSTPMKWEKKKSISTQTYTDFPFQKYIVCMQNVVQEYTVRYLSAMNLGQQKCNWSKQQQNIGKKSTSVHLGGLLDVERVRETLSTIKTQH